MGVGCGVHYFASGLGLNTEGPDTSFTLNLWGVVKTKRTLKRREKTIQAAINDPGSPGTSVTAAHLQGAVTHTPPWQITGYLPL